VVGSQVFTVTQSGYFQVLIPPGNKPKGMHWQTFWKLERQHNMFLKTSLDGRPERVYDIRTGYTGKAKDGTYYEEW